MIARYVCIAVVRYSALHQGSGQVQVDRTAASRFRPGANCLPLPSCPRLGCYPYTPPPYGSFSFLSHKDSRDLTMDIWDPFPNYLGACRKKYFPLAKLATWTREVACWPQDATGWPTDGQHMAKPWPTDGQVVASGRKRESVPPLMAPWLFLTRYSLYERYTAPCIGLMHRLRPLPGLYERRRVSRPMLATSFRT